MKLPRSLVSLLAILMVVSLFLVACESPLQEGVATITPAPDAAGDTSAEAADTEAADSATAEEVAEEEVAAEEEAAPAGEEAGAEAAAEEVAGQPDESGAADAGAEGEAAPGSEGALPGIAHTVAAGETLFNIASQYGVSWVEVAEYNGLVDVNFIRAGDVIYIPPVEDATSAEPEGASDAAGEQAAAEEAAEAETDEAVPAGTPHTVVEGETIFDVAAQYDVSWVAVAEFNQIEDVSSLEVGAVIYIPDADAEQPALSEDETTSEAAGEAEPAGGEDETVSEEPSSGEETGEAPGAEEPAGTPYTVAEGETIFDIAAKYNISWVVLAEFNRIEDVSTLRAGAVIFIPAAEAAISGETEEEAAGAESSAESDEEAAAEESEEAATGEAATEEEDLAGTPHTVAEGETIFDIAAQYDVSWVVLAEYNRIEDVNSLEIGAIIVIPVADAASADTASADTTSAEATDEEAAGAEAGAEAADTEAADAEAAGEEAAGESAAATTEAESSSAGSEAAGTQEIIYVVKPGDNLFRIGLQFGMSWVQIARDNGIVNPNLIKPGQELVIRTGGPEPPAETTYVVRQGDTLFKISQRFGVSWLEIARRNQLSPPYLIYAGQTLIIPGSS